MKTRLLLLLALTFIFKLEAQTGETVIIPNDQDSRVITTSLPFLLIASDARAASLGDMGVATSVDAFSQQWNASKYVFSETESGVSISYTPYLGKLVDDIFLGSLGYFRRLNERSAFAASMRYFSLGNIDFVSDEFSLPYTQRPAEFALDASYGLRLSDRFSMAVTMRYINSDLKLNVDDVDTKALNTFNVDLSGYYQSEEIAYNDFNGRWRGGAAIQNIGPKVSYDEGGEEYFQPTNLRLGGGFDFILDNYNKVAVTAEFTKLLVPTPPIMGTEYEDTNGDGEYDTKVSDDNGVIYKGKSTDVGFVQGMFQSFGDAPGGFSEELQEVTYAIGAEYTYSDAFAFRTAYFHESEQKGARQFLALGAGFNANVVGIDLSYLFSTSDVQSPLEGTLRFSLTINLGEGTYDEL